MSRGQLGCPRVLSLHLALLYLSALLLDQELVGELRECLRFPPEELEVEHLLGALDIELPQKLLLKELEVLPRLEVGHADSRASEDDDVLERLSLQRLDEVLVRDVLVGGGLLGLRLLLHGRGIMEKIKLK